MQTFTGFEYLLIDACNQWGGDKLTFDKRLEWANVNLSQLEQLVATAENKPLYMKAVMAIRKAQKGLPTGHLVGFDAVCSGVQVMSALTGCIAGATATGLVDPNVRADAYSKTTEVMKGILGTAVGVTRKQAKEALMTSFYGSKAKPIEIFGEDTPELNAFYEAANIVAPGAWELLQDLLASWQPMALVHAWKLPDGFDARVKVMEKVEARIEVDELDHASFTYEFYENKRKMKGLSNVANVVHSVDAYILRSIHRRCNYDLEVFQRAAYLIEHELIHRSLGTPATWVEVTEEVIYYVEQYERSGMADVVIVPHLTCGDMGYLTTKHLQALAEIIEGMLQYKPFQVVTIHDEFKCHANNMNYLRMQYRNMLAELAASNVLDDLLSQITGYQGTFKKLSTTLPELIKGSNYALC